MLKLIKVSRHVASFYFFFLVNKQPSLFPKSYDSIQKNLFLKSFSIFYYDFFLLFNLFSQSLVQRTTTSLRKFMFPVLCSLAPTRHGNETFLKKFFFFKTTIFFFLLWFNLSIPNVIVFFFFLLWSPTNGRCLHGKFIKQKKKKLSFLLNISV